MGANLDPGGGKASRNVDLNIVPYIDLMSCLTAFLLVAAVWTGLARLTVEPVGRARGPGPDVEPPPQVSVLIDADTIHVGVARSPLAPVRIARTDGDAPWTALAAALAQLHADETLAERPNIEVAADSPPEHPVRYAELVRAMDVAVAAGFTRPGVVDPAHLSWQPTP